MKKESYRDLSIINKAGQIHTVRLNSNHALDLILDQLILDINASNGQHILSQLRQITSRFLELEQVFNVPRIQFLQTLQTKMIPVISS